MHGAGTTVGPELFVHNHDLRAGALKRPGRTFMVDGRVLYQLDLVAVPTLSPIVAASLATPGARGRPRPVGDTLPAKTWRQAR